jgi:hypothetical protein
VLKRVWPHVVAAFVVFHLAANAVDLIPEVSQGMNRRAWQEPRVKAELTTWAQRLGMDEPALEDDLWSLGDVVVGFRSAVETPFRPYLRATGQMQTWAMFVAGTRDRDRFQLRTRTCDECAWTVVYQRGDDEHTFLRDVLEHPRIRSAMFRWGWPQLIAMYTRGCRAIARRTFAELHDVTAVQCRFERSESPWPRDPSPAPGEWGREIVVARGEVAP